MSFAVDENLSHGRVRELVALRFIGRNHGLFVAKSSKAKGDFVTATLKCGTYDLNVHALCTGTSGLLKALGMTGIGNAVSTRLGGVRGYPLFVVSSTFLISLSTGRHSVLLRVVRSHRREGSVVVASRLPMSS